MADVLKGIGAVVSTQILSRAVTFLLNVLVARLASPDAYGVGYVSLQLLSNLDLFVAKEGFRKAICRAAKKTRETPCPLETEMATMAMTTMATTTTTTTATTITTAMIMITTTATTMTMVKTTPTTPRTTETSSWFYRLRAASTEAEQQNGQQSSANLGWLGATSGAILAGPLAFHWLRSAPHSASFSYQGAVLLTIVASVLEAWETGWGRV
eukprot:s711_g13.t2